eukprot:GHRQ01033747.1.p3 GENE.GHRQ01033747.1~~GHRQ01033747.1.p3  ORF type:complete len:114 (-),score=32.42 GHRQ01033747.1:170-511(-)
MGGKDPSCPAACAISATMLTCAALHPARWLELGAASPHLMPHQLLDELAAIGSKMGNPELSFTPFANLLRTAVEAVVQAPSIAMVSRRCAPRLRLCPHACMCCMVVSGLRVMW